MHRIINTAKKYNHFLETNTPNPIVTSKYRIVKAMYNFVPLPEKSVLLTPVIIRRTA